MVRGLPASKLARHDVVQAADEAVERLLAGLRQEGVLTDVRPVLKTPEEAARLRPLYLDMVEDAGRTWDQAALVLDEAHSLHRRGAWNLVVPGGGGAGPEKSLPAGGRGGGAARARRGHGVATARRPLPAPLRAELPEVASISRRLGRERELSSYGDEESDTPPQELYTEADADQASADAEKVLGWARQALAAL
ncbi:hypothetical protein HRbin32_01740 [bacterium HR32]|nr:hypothetical protein HRbin32_01740 [bacterium HR32]